MMTTSSPGARRYVNPQLAESAAAYSMIHALEDLLEAGLASLRLIGTCRVDGYVVPVDEVQTSLAERAILHVGQDRRLGKALQAAATVSRILGDCLESSDSFIALEYLSHPNNRERAQAWAASQSKAAGPSQT